MSGSVESSLMAYVHLEKRLDEFMNNIGARLNLLKQQMKRLAGDNLCEICDDPVDEMCCTDGVMCKRCAQYDRSAAAQCGVNFQ